MKAFMTDRQIESQTKGYKDVRADVCTNEASDIDARLHLSFFKKFLENFFEDMIFWRNRLKQFFNHYPLPPLREENEF